MAGPDPRLLFGDTVDELKLGAEKPPMPFSDTRLLNVLNIRCGFCPMWPPAMRWPTCWRNVKTPFTTTIWSMSVPVLRQASASGAVEPVRRSMGDPLSTQNHHPLLRQADHRCDHQAVDRHFYAAQSVPARRPISRQHSCAEPLGDHRRQWQKADHQKRVLCL